MPLGQTYRMCHYGGYAHCFCLSYITTHLYNPLGPKNAADAEIAQFGWPLKGRTAVLSFKTEHRTDLLTFTVGIYIRGLYERYKTIPFDSPEAALIRSHITVQVCSSLNASALYRLRYGTL